MEIWMNSQKNNNDSICSILQPNRTPIASLATTGSSIIVKLLIATMLTFTLRRNNFAELATIDSRQRASWSHTVTFPIMSPKTAPKTSEIISSAESVTFDGHLVEIGDRVKVKKSPAARLISQVTLLIEGIILCRRFLKLWEHVTTGTTLNLPNYLAEVGDMGTSPEGEPQNGVFSLEHVDSKTASYTVEVTMSCRIKKAKYISSS